MSNTKEPQYNVCFEARDKFGEASLGLMLNHTWHTDPKRLLFVLSRYKFVAKMFEGFGSVLEIGCGDGFAARIVAQNVNKLTVSDFDPIFIDEARKQGRDPFSTEAIVHNFLDKPIEEHFQGIYCLDVLEHIEPDDETTFLNNIIASMDADGTAIFGMPSIHSQVYASKESKAGHVNCQSLPELRKTLQKFFRNVFIFSMNDEVVHTGYEKMSHYFLALCCSPKG